MWVTLFAITFVAALGFAAAAAWQSRKALRSFLAEVADAESHGGNQGPGLRPALDDDSLLLHRMKSLHINIEEMVRTEPRMFRSLVIRCWGCASKAQCKRDLCKGTACDEWRDYCPNASMLRAATGASHGIGLVRSAGTDRIPSSVSGC
jgi:hypothetical protein